MRAIAQSDGRTRPADLLHRDDMFEIAEAEAAILLAHRDPVQAQLAHRGPQLLARKPVLAIDLFGQRRDLFVGEARDGVADHLAAFAELEIEIGGGAHGLS